MRKCLLISIVVCTQLCVPALADTQVKELNLIPPEFSLSFDQAMRKVADNRLLVKCTEIPNSGYAPKDGTGYGVSGQGMVDRVVGHRAFEAYSPISEPTITNQPQSTAIKWYSSLTETSGDDSTFRVKSTEGTDHIHVSTYRDGVVYQKGDYYLRTIPAVSERTVTEIYVPVSNSTERRMGAFVQGRSVEAVFELSKSVQVSERGAVKIDAKIASVEGGAEVAHASATTRSIRVGTTDDGRSLMFPAEQKVTVTTIRGQLVVDKAGKAVRELRIDKSNEMLLTIQKVRPDEKGEYKCQRK